jgi:amidase
MLAFMDSFDLIVCPTSPGPADLHGERIETMFHYTLPFSLTGQPCVVVPCGRSPEGLPIAVQIVAGAWREDAAIAAARWIETTLGGWRRPPI